MEYLNEITEEPDYEKALEMVAEGMTHNEYNAELYSIKGTALEKLKDIKWNRDTVNEIIDVLRSPLMVE